MYIQLTHSNIDYLMLLRLFQYTGYWLHKQRRMKRLGTLPRIRFEKLDALAADTQGPGKLLWNMESAFLVRDDIWDKMCTAFEEYSAEHSSSLRTSQHSNLGMLVLITINPLHSTFTLNHPFDC